MQIHNIYFKLQKCIIKQLLYIYVWQNEGTEDKISYQGIVGKKLGIKLQG